jgi:mannose-6-phosphate isomerase-like protein (cupin superfamily)
VTSRAPPADNPGVAFDEFKLVGTDGWVDMPLDVTPRYLWADGGTLADAPVDFAKTFGTNMQVSANVDRSFNINGLRCSPNFAVPRHHHNLDELIIVFAGEFTVRWTGPDGEEQRRTVGPGEFWVSRAGTDYQMTAGPDGVTYTECWPEPMADLRTWWHDEGWVHR